MVCTIELSPHVVSTSKRRRFLRPVCHAISRLRKRPSNRSAFPSVTTCVYASFTSSTLYHPLTFCFRSTTSFVVRCATFSRFLRLSFHTIFLFLRFFLSLCQSVASSLISSFFLFARSSYVYKYVSSIHSDRGSSRVLRTWNWKAEKKGNFIVPENGGINGSRFPLQTYRLQFGHERSSLPQKGWRIFRVPLYRLAVDGSAFSTRLPSSFPSTILSDFSYHDWDFSLPLWYIDRRKFAGKRESTFDRLLSSCIVGIIARSRRRETRKILI